MLLLKIRYLIPALILLPLAALAGNLDSPAPPDDAVSAMYTVEDIYDRLNAGTAGAKRGTGFVEPSSGPGSTGRTLDEVMGAAPAADNTDGAAPAEVQNGKTYWGLRTDGTWGTQTGAMANVGQQTITPGTGAQGITQGYHDGTGTVAGDADLTAGNIVGGTQIFGVTGTALVSTGDAVAANVLTGKTFSNAGGVGISGAMANVGQQTINPGTGAQGITQGYHDGTGTVAGDSDLVSTNIHSGISIFGVAGDSNVANTSSGDAAAADIASGKKAWVDGSEVTGTSAPGGVPKTGQTTSFATGDDGDLEKGTTWPSPRFTDNGDGTVTDNLTNLIWTTNANCYGGTRTWAQAPSYANGLAAGSCGLTDSSSAGDWRLPNVRELQSLVDYGQYNPALPSGHPFSGVVVSNRYWASSTPAYNTGVAWTVNLNYGSVGNANKTGSYYVWPVRGGQ